MDVSEGDVTTPTTSTSTSPPPQAEKWLADCNLDLKKKKTVSCHPHNSGGGSLEGNSNNPNNYPHDDGGNLGRQETSFAKGIMTFFLYLVSMISYICTFMFKDSSSVKRKLSTESEEYAMSKKDDDFPCARQKESRRNSRVTYKALQVFKSPFRFDSDTDVEDASNVSVSSDETSEAVRRRSRANFLIRQYLKEEKIETMKRTLRVHACTWNVDQQPPPTSGSALHEWLLGNTLMKKIALSHSSGKETGEENNDNNNDEKSHFPTDEFPDVIIVTLQEVEMGGVVLVKEYTETGVMWVETIVDALNNVGEHKVWYRRLKLLQLVGLVLIVVVRFEHINYISNVRASLTRTGAMRGVWGNKGSIGIRATIYGKRFLFIAAHFVPHKHNERTRTFNYHAALYDLCFETPADVDDEMDVLETFSTATRDSDLERDVTEKHSRWGFLFRNFRRTSSIMCEREVLDKYDYVFFMGDLNSRLHGMKGADIRRLVRNGEYDFLICHDELRQGMVSGDTFDGFQEALIAFPPTYKLDHDADTYDTSRKKRDPAWCDRILFRASLPSDEGKEGEEEVVEEETQMDDKAEKKKKRNKVKDTLDNNVQLNTSDMKGVNNTSCRTSSRFIGNIPLPHSMPEPRVSCSAASVSNSFSPTSEEDAAAQSSVSSSDSVSLPPLRGQSDSIVTDERGNTWSLGMQPSMKAKVTAQPSLLQHALVHDEAQYLPTFLSARRATCIDNGLMIFPAIRNSVFVLDYHNVPTLRQSDHRPVSAQFEVCVLSLPNDLVDNVLKQVYESISPPSEDPIEM